MPLTDNLTDREFLEQLAGRLDQFITDTEKQLEHLDEGIHDVHRKVSEIEKFIDENRPGLARAQALMNGPKLAGWRKTRGQTDG